MKDILLIAFMLFMAFYAIPKVFVAFYNSGPVNGYYYVLAPLDSTYRKFRIMQIEVNQENVERGG